MDLAAQYHFASSWRVLRVPLTSCFCPCLQTQRSHLQLASHHSPSTMSLDARLGRTRLPGCPVRCSSLDKNCRVPFGPGHRSFRQCHCHRHLRGRDELGSEGFRFHMGLHVPCDGDADPVPQGALLPCNPSANTCQQVGRP